jgi:hypothetical protein
MMSSLLRALRFDIGDLSEKIEDSKLLLGGKEMDAGKEMTH